MLEKNYSNLLKFIESLPNGEIKRKAIGALICDIGKNCINTIAKGLNLSWNYVKKCYYDFLNLIPKQKENRGSKPAETLFPSLLDDLKKIVEENACCDPDFKHEKRYVRLTVDEIKIRLIETGNYSVDKCPSKSVIKRCLKKINVILKKVKKTEPLKKIAETDDIFENIKVRKEKCMNDDKCVLISIDTKDRVAIGEYSRGGYSYNEVKAFDHDFKKKFVIPFGILDIKMNEPHFYNVESKVTAECMVECIEDFLVKNYFNKAKNITKLAILSDNGPENSSSRSYYIYQLINLAKIYNIKIELIYYPPYHSKYNPVERIWARLENIWNGSLLTDVLVVLNFMKNLTWKGQISTVKEITKEYCTGLKINKKALKALKDKHVTCTKGIEKWALLINP